MGFREFGVTNRLACTVRIEVVMTPREGKCKQNEVIKATEQQCA